jgi:hypothetical protein
MRRNLLLPLAAASFVLPSVAWSALDPIPEESGWSGSILFGGGWTWVESNELTGNDVVDIGNDRIDNVEDGPDEQDAFLPALSGDIRYTFGKSRTQVYFGRDITDLVRFDFSQLLGVRRQFDGIGILGLSYAFTNLPTQVWEDPYLAGAKREDTDRDSSGFRFDWSRILNSGFSFHVNTREVDVDTERSGTDPALGLTDDEIRLLRRDGDNLFVNLEYLWKIAPNQVLIPEVSWANHDRDGDAISRDEYGGKLTWSLLGDPWTFVLTGGLYTSEFDKRNPIYDKKQDADSWNLGGTVFYTLGDSKRWSLFGSAVYADSDSDIEFHDTTITMLTVGARFRFGQQL